MSRSNSRLNILFQRYHHNIASDEDIAELMKIIRESEDDEQINRIIKDAWEELDDKETFFDKRKSFEMLGKVLNQIGDNDEDAEQKHTGHSVFSKWYYAKWYFSAAVLVIGLFFFWNLEKKENSTKNELPTTTEAIIPGGNKATLTLADGSEILLDYAEDGQLALQGKTEINKSANGEIVYNLLNDNIDHSANANEFNTISTPKGGNYKIALPDGSVVWLNASSSLTFPVRFNEHERRVTVSGEAYFEILKDSQRPFKVLFGKNEVTVLGTSFNVRNYEEEPIAKTTLIEGSVRIKSGEDLNQLLPGEQLSVRNDGTISKSKVDVFEVIAWKNGMFYFQSAELLLVMAEVSRWYNVEVEFAGDPSVRQFTGKIARNVKIEKFMDMLDYIGVKYQIEGRKIIVMN